jgi:energy-coupling factor transporter ATP-binding protein EcfA2
VNRPGDDTHIARLRGIGRIERLTADVERLQRGLGEVPLWTPAAALAVQCGETVRLIRSIAARFERSAVVTLIGPSGSGKSTLVNALSGGRELSPSGHRRPTTGGLVILGDGRDVTELLDDSERGGVEVRPAAALPERLCLVDTPDTDSMEAQRHRPALERAVAHSDILVCVFDAENPKRRDHADLLAPFVQRFDGESLVAVLNKCDRLDESELREQILPDFEAYLRRWRRPIDRILCASARRHLQDPGWDPGAGPRHEFDQFDELQTLVFGMAGGGARIIDRRVENARRLHAVMLEEAGRELAADRDPAQSALEALAAARVQAFGVAAAALRDTDPRQGGGWGPAFYQSLAARWVGPVGWVLALWTRVAALGAGIAHLLRRVRGHRDETGEGGEPARGGTAPALEAYRVAVLSRWPAVAEPLVRARFAPSVRSLDVPLESAAQIAGRLADVWDEAVRCETERAARRLSGTWLQLLLNAPVTAVLAYVGWVVVVRFFRGDYLPGDFFVHAFWVAAITLILSFFALQLVIRISGTERVIGRAFEAVRQVEPDLGARHPVEGQVQRLLALGSAHP